jgi:hypothetical protein
MPGTGAENSMGSVCRKPEMSCLIEFMDISSETSQNHFFTTPVLSPQLRDLYRIRIMPGTGAENVEGVFAGNMNVMLH